MTLLAIGQKLPAWAETACEDYLKRFPPDWSLKLGALKAEPRNLGKTVTAMQAAERARLEAALPRGARVVVLDERGQSLNTRQLADRLQAWEDDGREVALLMGGPDGLDAGLKAAADERLRLSDLTLPHALARVVCIEALYRAWSLRVGHPYHRE